MRVLGRILLALAAIAAALAAVGAVFGAIVVIGVRRRDPRVLGPLLRFQRDVVNPAALETAGRAGDPHSIIRHVGRRSGREYATPVGAVALDGGFEIPLVYGPGAQWAQNVMAAGSAVIEYDGARYEVHSPEVVPIETTTLAIGDEQTIRVFGIREALRLRTDGEVGSGA